MRGSVLITDQLSLDSGQLVFVLGKGDGILVLVSAGHPLNLIAVLR